MPRVSLPSHFKNLRTYNVLLTQTTEDDLLDHFRRVSETYSYQDREFHNELFSIIEAQHSVNPYRSHNWRRGTPERRYKNGWEWISMDDEKKYEAYQRLVWFGFDFKKCDDEFHWTTNPETAVWAEGFLRQTEQHRLDSVSMIRELAEIDARNFATAKKEWETDDAEWIDRKKRLHEHSFHRPRQYYLDEIARDPDAKAWYESKGGIPNYEETCEFCRKQKEEDDARTERLRQEEEERREEERLAEEKRLQEELLRKAQRKAVVSAPRVLHRCEDCDFQTYTELVYVSHMKSREHLNRLKLKAWFCSACETQCRTQVEYDNHTQTAKHKKAVSGTGHSWSCEACGYTATKKHHYEAHMTSKKHLARVGTAEAQQEVVVPMAGQN